MNSQRTRPWYRLHWVTWLIVGIVGGALVYSQFQGQTDGFESSFSWELSTGYGWPVKQLTVTEFGSYELPLLGPPNPSFTYQWNWVAIVVAAAVSLVLLCSTAWVLECWLRSPNRLQFSLRSLLIVSTVIGILLAALSQLEAFQIGSLLLNLDFAPPIRWPLLFGLANALYASAWLVSGVLLRWFTSRSHA